MKKLTFLMILLFAAVLYAQDAEVVEINSSELENPWTFGAKVGMNVATLAGSYTDIEWVDDIDGIIGFHAGGWVNYELNDKMAIQVELLGSIQGADINYEEIPNPITGERIKPTAKMRLPYMMLPVMFQYKPMEKLYLEAGPQINYLPKVNIKAFLNGKEVEDEQAANIVTNRLKNVNNFDFGLNIGAGYEFIPDWTFYARYTHGMITVDDRETNQRDLKNRIFAFGVAYEF